MPVNDRTRVLRCAAPNYSRPIQINHRRFLGGYAAASRLSPVGKALTPPNEKERPKPLLETQTLQCALLSLRLRLRLWRRAFAYLSSAKGRHGIEERAAPRYTW
jgi:hypothetical protein